MTILKSTNFTGSSGATITTGNTGFDSVTLDGAFPQISGGGRYPNSIQPHYYNIADSNPNYGSFTGVTNVEHYVRCYTINISMATSPGFFVRAVGRYLIGLNSAMEPTLFRGDASSAVWTSTHALSTGTEYRFEWHHTVADGNTRLRVYVLDNPTPLDDSGAFSTTTSTASSRIDFGNIFGSDMQAGVIDDGLLIGDAAGGWLGAGDYAPNAPTLNSPPNDVVNAIDVTATQRFAWTFSDPDSGDSQSKFDLRYSSDSGATWTTITGSTPNTYVDVASGTFTSGSTYEWQVRTYDSTGTQGPYSSSWFFLGGTPSGGPTITYPTSGGTVQQSDSVTWSTPTQTDYQVQRCADDSGSIDTSTVYFDSGDVVSATTRTLALTFATNSRFEWIRVRFKLSGLWSDWTAVRVDVSYTPPPTPVGDLVAFDPTGLGFAPSAFSFSWATDAPSGDEPAATSVDVYLSTDGGVTSIRVATEQPTNSNWVYWVPASGVDYSFQAVAVADNGTSSGSSWVGVATIGPAPVDEDDVLIISGGVP